MKRFLKVFVLLAVFVGVVACKPKQEEPEKPVKTDQEIVDEVYNGLTFNKLEGLTNEDPRLIFPTTKDGTTITWNIDSVYILESGMINQPTHDVGDQTVTITATIKKGNITKIKTFTATVLALPKPSEQTAYLDEDFTGFEDGNIIPQTATTGVWGVVSGKAGNSTFVVVSDAPEAIPSDSKALKINAFTELQIEANVTHETDVVVFEADFLQTPGAKAIQLQNHTSGSGSTFAFGITGTSVYYRIDASGEVKPEGNIANSKWFRLRVELDYVNKTFQLFKYVDGNLVSLSGLVTYTNDVAVNSLYLRSGSSNETSLNENSSYITNIVVNRLEALPRPQEVVKLGEVTGITPTLSLELGNEYVAEVPVVKGLYGDQGTLVLSTDYKVEVIHEIDIDTADEYVVTYKITNLHDSTDVKEVTQTVTVYSTASPNEIQTTAATLVLYEEQKTDLTVSFVRAEGKLYYAFGTSALAADTIKAANNEVSVDALEVVLENIAVLEGNLYLVVENEAGFSAVKEVVLQHQEVIEVKTAEEFYQMTQTTTAGKYYLLKNDIDFASYTWVYGNQAFKSTFNGGGFTVKNITVDGTDRTGIFSRLDGAIVKNLVIDNVKITSTNRSGGLVGEVQNNPVTIENVVVVNSDVSGANDNGVGGLVGFVSKTTLNVNNVAVIDTVVSTPNKNVSAVVARVEGAVGAEAAANLTDVYVNGVVVTSTSSGTSDVGVSALVGYLRNNYSTASIQNSVVVDTSLVGPMAGAVIGYVRDGALATLNGIFVEASITFSDARAGLVGRYNNCTEKYDVSKVFGQLTFSQEGYIDAPHAEVSMLVLENIVPSSALTKAKILAKVPSLLETLWNIPDVGAPVLKNAAALLTPTYQVTIKFDSVHSLADEILNVKEGETITFTAPLITGYDYIGLFTDSERTAAYDLETLITGNVTLYAKYEKVTTAKVSFDTLGGPAVDPVTVNIDSTLGAFPEVANHEFDGIMKEVTGWTLNGEPFALETVITGNITLVAVWEGVVYTVTVDGVEQTVAHGALATEGTLNVHPTYPDELVAYWVSGGAEFTFDTPIVADTVITQAYKLKETVTALPVSTVDQLRYMIFEGPNYSYELANDIDLTSVVWTKPSDVKFRGSLDGKGFIISNLSYTGDGRVGLFPYIAGATVKNLVIDGFNLTSNNDRAGILAAEIDSGISTISNTVIKNSSVLGNKNEGVGGVLGYVRNTNTVLNLTNVALLNVSVSTGQKYAGGLVGRLRNGATLNATDIYIKDVTTSTTSTSTDGGSAPLVAYLNEANATLNATRVVIDNFIGKGAAVGSLLGFSQNGTFANFVDVYTYAKLEGTARSNAVSRHQTPGTTFDLSDVYYTVTGLVAHDQSQVHDPLNEVTLEELNNAWWSTNFALGELWTIPATGIPILKIAN